MDEIELNHTLPPEDMKIEDLRKYYIKYGVIRSRCKQLIEGRGGIMEMKQTIANKEQEIERLEKAYNNLKATFRINMMRHAGASHAEIDEFIEKATSLKETIFPNIDKVTTVYEEQPDIRNVVGDDEK